MWKEIDYGKMTDKEKEMLVSEVNLLRDFKHPHIVRYVDRIVDRDATTIYIVMEYCEGGDLAALVKQHKRERCAPVVLQHPSPSMPTVPDGWLTRCYAPTASTLTRSLSGRFSGRRCSPWRSVGRPNRKHLLT